MSTHRFKTLAQTSHNLTLTSQDCSIVLIIEFWLTDNLWINPYKLLFITVSRFGKSWFAYIALIALKLKLQHFFCKKIAKFEHNDSDCN